MKAEQAISFPYPLATVWPVVAQVDVIARAFPGAELTGPADGGGHQGTMTVKLGPTRVRWNGTARFTFQEDQGLIEIEARGADSRGRSRAQADAVVTLSDASTGTTGMVSCTMHVEGPLASIASTAGVYVLEDLLGQVEENLTTEIAGVTTGSPVTTTPPPEPAPTGTPTPAPGTEPPPVVPSPAPPRTRSRELSALGLIGRVARQRLAALARWLRKRLTRRRGAPR